MILGYIFGSMGRIWNWCFKQRVESMVFFNDYSETWSFRHLLGLRIGRKLEPSRQHLHLRLKAMFCCGIRWTTVYKQKWENQNEKGVVHKQLHVSLWYVYNIYIYIYYIHIICKWKRHTFVKPQRCAPGSLLRNGQSFPPSWCCDPRKQAELTVLEAERRWYKDLLVSSCLPPKASTSGKII